MSELLLVRHAQASFLDEDYDWLSELGRAQARALGGRWAQLGLGFDRWLSGPRLRQRDTALECGEALRSGGGAAPELEVLEDLDEYPAEEVLRGLAPVLATEEPGFGELAETFANSGERRARGRAFDKMLQLALVAWAEGRAVDGVESYAEFTLRAQRSLELMTSASGSGLRVAAFTSAGTIGALVGHTLGTRPRATLELGWMLNNASVSELLFSPGRTGLVRLNTIGHLPDPRTWTRR